MSNLLVPRSDVGEFRKRYKWMALFVFIAFAIVVGRLFQLQVVSGPDYAAIAHENIIRHITLQTTRGSVVDAYGQMLASSRISLNVEVIPGRVLPSARPERPTGGHPEKREPDAFTTVCNVLRLNPDERARLEARIREVCTTDEDKSPCWRPILVREDVSREIYSELQQHMRGASEGQVADHFSDEIAGVRIIENHVRSYPKGTLGAHLLGYVAEIDPDALGRLRPDGYDKMTPEQQREVNPLGYNAGDYWGATGIEHAWESSLRGQRGWRKVVVDARGRYRKGPEADRLVDEPREQEPIPGRSLRLSIDSLLQEQIKKAMSPYLSGAVVALEVRTGRLLALYSQPDFDPNDLSGGAGHAKVRETFNKLYPDYLRPMLDKTMSGVFPPGSTFKPFAALAALENHTVRPEDYQNCEGQIAFRRQIMHCTHVHGPVNMRDAIAQSCNIYFFRLAEATELDPMAKVATEFGLGSKTGLRVNPEAAGRIPTRAWYSLHFPHARYVPGYALNTAIGQGDVTVTPLQLAFAYSAIGNGGTLYQPQLVRAIETSEHDVVQEFPPRIRRRVNIRPENLSRVLQGLYDVVNSEEGTAYPARDPTLDISGKTGTAQVGHHTRTDDDQHIAAWREQAHAWFAAFSPSKAPEIAVVVLVEHGESGPKVAHVAIETIRAYYDLRECRKNPDRKECKKLGVKP